MRLGPLEKVKHKIAIAKPLPCGIRDAGGRLLLARGHVLTSDEQFDALLERGAFVDLDELVGPRAEILQAPPERLPALWRAFAERVNSLLHAAPTAGWPEAMDDAARTALTLVDRLPDMAIFQIVRADAPPAVHHGVLHSLHAAATTALVGRRLGWPDPTIVQIMRAAMTMNLGAIDLHGRMASQTQAPTALQRAALREHPQRSVEMLRTAGVTDAAWLAAVAHHHEPGRALGPMQGEVAPDDMAGVLRVADIYTSKLSARATRKALAPNVAAKQLFTAEAGSGLSAAIVKEFGVFPPGTNVMLASGEVGVVVRRGDNAGTPVVAALVGRSGDALMQPIQRDTALRQHAITQVVDSARLPVRVAPETLFADRL